MFSLGNIFRLKQSGIPFPALVNILVAGGLTFVLFGSGVAIFTDYSYARSMFDRNWCQAQYDDSYHTPVGSFEECVSWAKAYMGVTYTYATILVLSRLVSRLSPIDTANSPEAVVTDHISRLWTALRICGFS